jgi:hypothetical protein
MDAMVGMHKWQIPKWSFLCAHSEKALHSEIFVIGGFAWRIRLYPRGAAQGACEEHVSMYLRAADPGGLPDGWEVTAGYKLSVEGGLTTGECSKPKASAKPKESESREARRRPARPIRAHALPQSNLRRHSQGVGSHGLRACS